MAKRLVDILCVLFLFTSCKTTQQGPLYKIKLESGDTLSSIAMKYDTNVDSIVRLNDLESPSDINHGQILYLRPGPKGYVVQDKRSLTNQDDAPRKRGGFFFGGGGDNIIWPVSGSVSSEFGMRHGRPHHGIDIRSPYGTPIKAVADGSVKSAGWISGYGRMVVVSHDGFETLYAHCSKLNVKKGDQIRQGQVIGLVGTSGRSTGPHLHFEYRSASGKPMNPRRILKESLLSRN